MAQIIDIFRREDDSFSMFRIVTFIATVVFIYSALLEMHTSIVWAHFVDFGYIVVCLIFGCGCNKVIECKYFKVSDAPAPAVGVPPTDATNIPGQKGVSI